MSKGLVIGYGNTLRGDDAAGVRAAESLARQHPEFDYLYLHQLVPEVAEQISHYELVFFIDAQTDIAEPIARLITLGIETDQPRTHFISPESLLALSQQLYQHIPSKAYIIGIPASEFEFSENLSVRTETGVHECVVLVERIVRELPQNV